VRVLVEHLCRTFGCVNRLQPWLLEADHPQGALDKILGRHGLARPATNGLESNGKLARNGVHRHNDVAVQASAVRHLETARRAFMDEGFIDLDDPDADRGAY
jgi:hypothetical protein